MLLLEWKWSMHSPCQERTFAKFPYFIRILKSIWFLLLLPHHANPTEVFPHILHHPLCTEYSRWLIWGPGMNKNYVKHALKSPQKFRTQDCSSANLLGSWHISGLKSKSYYEILIFWCHLWNKLSSLRSHFSYPTLNLLGHPVAILLVNLTRFLLCKLIWHSCLTRHVTLYVKWGFTHVIISKGNFSSKWRSKHFPGH